MDYKINLNEVVKISEHIRAETEIDAIIYQQEFNRHRAEYQKSKEESELIFTFIFLQMYIECFLHQNMRRIVELEFKPPRDNVCTDWLTGEKRKIPQKTDDFPTLFFNPVPQNIQNLADDIKNKFYGISGIRNLLVHGHKVAAWFDSDGNSGSSPAKSFLTESQLNQSIIEANELGTAWNYLLDAILPQCKALQRITDFKFIKI